MSAIATMPGLHIPHLRERLLMSEHLNEVATPRTSRNDNTSSEPYEASQPTAEATPRAGSQYPYLQQTLFRAREMDEVTRAQPGNAPEQASQFPFLRELFRRSARGRKSSRTSSAQSSETQPRREDSFSTAEQLVGRGLGKLDLESLPRDDGPLTELQARREKFAYFENKCSQVATDLFVGGELVARDRKLLKEAGITHVVNCIQMICPDYFSEDFKYLSLAINDATQEDITSLLYDVFSFMEEALSGGGKVFVHCSQGVSRSATFVIAYLMYKLGRPYNDVYTDVKAIRGVINPNIGFTCQLLNWQKRRAAQVDSCRVYKIARHSENERYPEYLVAKPINNPTVAVMESHSALLVRVPATTFIWQGAQCSSDHLAAAHRAASGFARYEDAPRAVVIQQGSEPAELMQALGAEPTAGQATSLVAQMKLPSIVTAERSGESSAPNSARAKTPREEAHEGPYGIRSPNQRSRKAMRSDAASGAVTDRSRTSESEAATASNSPRVQATAIAQAIQLQMTLSSRSNTPRSTHTVSSPRLAFSAHATNSPRASSSPRNYSPRTIDSPRSADAPRTPRSPLAGGAAPRRSPRKSAFKGMLRLQLPLQ